MNLKDIMAVSGKPGLYKLVAQNKGNIVVESLEDAKKMPVYASQQISSLSEISMYTYAENVALKDIYKSIFEKKGDQPAPEAKSDPKDLKSFMDEVLPDWDKERVYISDIKKLVTWYNILLKNGLIDAEEEESEKAETAEPDEPESKSEETAE